MDAVSNVVWLRCKFLRKGWDSNVRTKDSSGVEPKEQTLVLTFCTRIRRIPSNILLAADPKQKEKLKMNCVVGKLRGRRRIRDKVEGHEMMNIELSLFGEENN